MPSGPRHIRKALVATAALCLSQACMHQMGQSLVYPQLGEQPPVELPNGPLAPGVDLDLFSNVGNTWFETFYVEEMERLQDVLDDGRVAADTRVVVFEGETGTLSLLIDQMSYHHMAQGTDGGKDWMATFCVVCNTGTSLVPAVDGRTLHFRYVGLYEGLAVMQDAETKTLWRHITGEPLFGPLVGETLGPIRNLLQKNVEQALAADPETRVAISDQKYYAGGRAFGGGLTLGGAAGVLQFEIARGGVPTDNAQLSDLFVETLGEEDNRRPRMETGLGISVGQTSRYYPLAAIREQGRAFIDEIDGRNALIYIDRDTNTPAAIFTDASSAASENDGVHLDTGAVLRQGVLYDASGERIAMEQPLQLFTRWYGFALTFPDCEIYGE